MNIKFKSEHIFLIVFIALFLFLGVGTTYNHKFINDAPKAYLAMDYGWKTSRAKALIETGSHIYRPDYLSAGLSKTVETYPPLWGHELAILKNANTLPLFDNTYLLVFFNVLVSILICYLILRRFNKSLAMIGLPISLFILIMPFAVAMIFGFHSMILSNLFLIAIIYLTLFYFNKKFFPYLASILCVASFLAHQSEFFYAVGAISIYSVYILIKEKFSMGVIKDIAKKAGIMILLIILFTNYFIPLTFPNVINEPSITPFNRLKGGARFTLFKWEQNQYERNPYVTHFSWFIILIYLGMALSLFIKKQKKFTLMFFFLFLLSFTPYLGFKRIAQFRYFWPIYLMFFFGMSMYYPLKLIKLKKSIKKWVPIGISILFIILFITIFYDPIIGTGITNQEWDAINWIKENTPEDARFFYFYSIPASTHKSAITFSDRLTYQLDYSTYVSLSSNTKIFRFVNTTPISNDRKIYERISFNEFIRIDIQDTTYSFEYVPRDICDFDYFTLNVGDMSEPAFNYANLLFSHLISSGNVEQVYKNSQAVILKNKNVGGNCI